MTDKRCVMFGPAMPTITREGRVERLAWTLDTPPASNVQQRAVISRPVLARTFERLDVKLNSPIKAAALA